MFEKRSPTSYKSIANSIYGRNMMISKTKSDTDKFWGVLNIWTNLKTFTKKCFVASLVEYGPVVLEKKVYSQIYGNWSKFDKESPGEEKLLMGDQ